MSKVALTFEVDEDVRAILAYAAKVTGRDITQLVRDLAEDYAHQQQVLIDEPDWLIQEIDAGLRAADDPNAVWVSHEDAQAEMQHQREDLRRRLTEQERNR